jgi:energy-coupling factor transporter ATP-binding protein EcfA2
MAMTDMQSIQNPFPGLRPFGYDQRHLFFGREEQISESLRQLQETRFLMVVGPSGSGKSSMINAGLIPGLYSSEETSTNWKTATLRPGDDPLGNMAQALSASDILHTDDTDQFRSGTITLPDLAQKAGLSTQTPLLLFVDQFEEIFRYDAGGAFNAQDANTFIKLLLDAYQQPACPIYVLLTMRADFLGRCTVFPGLPEAINVGQYLVPRLTPDQIQDAIVKPIQVNQAEITEHLVERLLNDLEGNQSQLPIMQHALMRTWDHWAENQQQTPIDETHYEAIGTIKEALSQHAEETYNDLPNDEARHITQMLFKCLTDKTSNANGVRRPTPLGEVSNAANVDPEQVKIVVEHFRAPGRWFLTSYPGVELHEGTILDLVHESLMRVWQRLQTWLEEEGASAVLYLRLANTAALYQEGRAGLYKGPDLELALNWQTQYQPTSTWGKRYDPTFERAITFLGHSKKEHDFEITTRETQQKRQLKRARVLAISGGGVALIFLLLSLFALDLFFDAERQRLDADKARKNAVEQQQVADEARKNAIVQQQLAVDERKKAIEQRHKADDERLKAENQGKIAVEQRRKAEKQQQIAVEQRKFAIEQQEIAVQQQRKAENQEKIAIKEKNKAYQLRLLSIAQSLAIQSVKIQRNGQTERGALLALQAFLFNEKYGGSAQNPDIYQALHLALSGLDENAQHMLRGHDGAIRDLAYYPNSTTLASASDDGHIGLWDMQTLTQKSTLRTSDSRVRSIAVSPKEQWLASGGTEGGIQVWKIDTPNAQPIQLLAPLEETIISALTFDPTETYLSAGSLNGQIWTWHVGLWTEMTPLSRSTNERIQTVAFTSDGHTLAWAGSKGVIHMIKVQNPSQTTTFSDNQTPILSIDFSPDGQHLASGNTSGDILIWDVQTPQAEPVRLIGHTSSVTSVSFNPDNQLLASGSLDKTLRIWNIQYPDAESISIEHDHWVWAVTFNPSGDRLVSGSANQIIYTWTTRAEALAEQVCDKITRNLSIKEWKTFVGEDIPYEKTCPSLPGDEQVLGNTTNKN